MWLPTRAATSNAGTILRERENNGKWRTAKFVGSLVQCKCALLSATRVCWFNHEYSLHSLIRYFARLLLIRSRHTHDSLLFQPWCFTSLQNMMVVSRMHSSMKKLFISYSLHTVHSHSLVCRPFLVVCVPTVKYTLYMGYVCSSHCTVDCSPDRVSSHGHRWLIYWLHFYLFCFVCCIVQSWQGGEWRFDQIRMAAGCLVSRQQLGQSELIRTRNGYLGQFNSSSSIPFHFFFVFFLSLKSHLPTCISECKKICRSRISQQVTSEDRN